MKKYNTILLHLTDLHFGDNLSKSFSVTDFSYNDIAKLITDTIKSEYKSKKLIIAFGGDITNKGQSKKYQSATDFIRKIKNELSDYDIEIILCPGNHDIEITTENWFDSFNNFSSEITMSDNFIFTKNKTSLLFENDNWVFIAINSVFHGNKDFGLIDLNNLESNLALSKKPTILLTHHHLIPILGDDISTTRNSYDLLRLCQHYNVKLILHGHIHSSFKLDVINDKSNIRILGCGATLPQLSANYNNQFNIIELNNDSSFDISNFKITYDSIESHKPQCIKQKI